MENFLRKHKGYAVVIFPVIAIYLFKTGDMTAFALYAIAALFLSLVVAVNAINKAETWQRLFAKSRVQVEQYKLLCEERDRAFQERDRAYRQMSACYQFLLYQQEIEKHGSLDPDPQEQQDGEDSHSPVFHQVESRT